MNKIAAIFAVPVAIVFRGFVLTKLWSWFVVSTFQVEPISIAAAIGIAALLAMVTHQEINVKEEEVSLSERLLKAFLVPLMMLAFGYIIYQFV